VAPGSPDGPTTAVNEPDADAELADLRRRWGEAYRITWDSGRFRATHIISGRAIDADNAAGLHVLIRHHYTSHATSGGRRVSACRVTTTRPPTAVRTTGH
jgi:hypothetical protein